VALGGDGVYADADTDGRFTVADVSQSLRRVEDPRDALGVDRRVSGVVARRPRDSHSRTCPRAPHRLGTDA
jgi:hypothetical protein